MANKLFIDKKTGKKMYPVGKWMTYQHVFYNESDRAYNNFYDKLENGTVEEFEKANDWKEKVEELLTKWNSNPQDSNGIVYALYEDYKIMKDIIGGYVWRHNGHV